MIHLSDTDQAPYSAPAPQTATVSDEAVQAMPERIYAVQSSGKSVIGFDTPSLDYKFEYVRADIAALSAAPCSVEVKDILATLDECWEYFDNKADVEDDADGPIANAELHLLTQVKEAHKALSAILSQIVTKPVDVAAVRGADVVAAAKVAQKAMSAIFMAGGLDVHSWWDDLIAAQRGLAKSIHALSPAEPFRKFKMHDRLTKIKGSKWTGRVVGFYSTDLTPIGYAIESETEKGSVQIYPESALMPAPSREGG